VFVELDRMTQRQRHRDVGRPEDERLHLLGRGAGVGAALGDERDVPTGGVDAVDHQVADTRHRHQLRDPVEDDSGIGTAGERAWIIVAQLMALAAPEAHGPVRRARQAEAHPGAARQLFGEPGQTPLERVGIQRLRRVQHVEEGVETGRDRPEAVALVRPGIAVAEKILVEIVEEVLDGPRALPPASADAAQESPSTASPGSRDGRGLHEVLDDPALQPATPGDVAK
jgi:hypothetical protein